jgi:hypothetical protein
VEVDGFVLFCEAMERFKAAGVDFGENRWETWVRCGLMERTERIPGTNFYGFRLEQWTRLKTLVFIDSQLLGRKSPEAVAYYAALWGIEVPANLVADHLVKSISTFYSLMRRRLIRQSNGRYDPRMLAEPDVRKLAAKSAEDILRISPIRNRVKRAFARQFAEELSFVIIQTTYDVRPSPSIEAVIRRVANAIFKAPAALGARLIRKVLDNEGARFVDPQIGNNRILEEIRSTQRDQPELILRACRDSGIAFAALTRAFGLEEQHQNGHPPNELTGTARENARTFYALLPLASAYLLAWNLDFPKSQALAMLRKSEGAEFEYQLRRLDRISEWQRRRLEKRP